MLQCLGMRRGVRVWFVLLAVLFVAPVPPTVSAAPNSIAVTDCGNYAGSGSFSAAVLTLQGVGGGVITFSCMSGTGDIIFPGAVTISSNFIIDARGSTKPITFDGNYSTPLFSVIAGGTLEIDGLTLANGKSSSDTSGGAISNLGTLRVTDCIFSHNSAKNAGGAINADQGANSLTISRSTFIGNVAVYGGAIVHGGAAVAPYPVSMTVTDSTFYDNFASGYGGGIASYEPAVVTNSTFAHNQAFLGGGAIQGVAIANYNPLTIVNSILVHHPMSNNCMGPITDQGWNIADDTTCAFSGPSSHNSLDPKLDPAGPANNGGPTLTIALQRGSPAIDANTATCPGTDQRGIPRPQGPSCDIGAFEATVLSTAARPIIVRGNAWYFRNALSGGAPDNAFSFGAAGDIPLSCDADGNGSRSVAIVRKVNGSLVWYTRTSNTPGSPDAGFPFGSATDIPLCGDWDGNGTETPGLARISGGSLIWILANQPDGSGPLNIFAYGAAGDTPVVGDWNGDKVASVGIVRSVGGSLVWYLRDTNSGGNPDHSFAFGSAGDRPVVGDWDGTGTTTQGITRTAGGTLAWYWRNTLNTGPVDGGMLYGGTGDVPLVWFGSGFFGQTVKK